MRTLEEFHLAALANVPKGRKFVLSDSPVDPEKRFRLFNLWRQPTELEPVFEAIASIKHPLYVTYDSVRPRELIDELGPGEKNIDGIIKELFYVKLEDVCGEVLSVYVDDRGISAECVATGIKGDMLLAMRTQPDIIVPRLRTIRTPPGSVVTKIIGFDISFRNGKQPAKIEFWASDLKPEFFLNPRRDWEVPETLRVTVNYPWPAGIDKEQALAVAREQFETKGVARYPYLVKRVDKTKKPCDALKEEEIVGRCQALNFNDKQMSFEFLLCGPNATDLAKKLTRSFEPYLALPFIVKNENNEVQTFGNVFIVERTNSPSDMSSTLLEGLIS